MTRSKPPATDEFEISVLGPGRGECIILHLGKNEWCVVDSCIPKGRSKPAAVEYLSSFNNDALVGIKVIVATHWHDDHIRGLADTLASASKASFFCSNAFDSEIFFRLVGTAANSIQGNSGVDEFAAILGLMEQGAPAKLKRLATPKWLVENRTLFDSKNDRPFPIKITALSPADGTIKTAYAEMAKLLPKPGDLQRRITSLEPNHTSVVLWVEAGPLRALLGADLEVTATAVTGWSAVLTCHRSNEREKGIFFKVPHHGSKNGDSPEVWREMLHPDPVAVVTPYFGGSVRLPQEADFQRLMSKTTGLYCTAPGAGKAPPRDSVVERAMRELSERRVVEGEPGHVRVRWSLAREGAAPTIEMFHGAFKV